MKRMGLLFMVALVVTALALAAGCGSDGGSVPGGGASTDGKAQALVFTQPG